MVGRYILVSTYHSGHIRFWKTSWGQFQGQFRGQENFRIFLRIYLVLLYLTQYKLWFENDHCRTISGHFLAVCMFIFHKTEVQTVILKCLTGLNLDWFKSYGLRCILRPRASSANSQKIATDKWSFYDHMWSFFCQLHVYLSQNWDSDGHFEVLNKSKY